MVQARQEIQKVEAVPLVIGQFMEMVDKDYAIVNSGSGPRTLRGRT
eukprot:g15628.t1